jgi:hypothetical protein
MFGTAFRAHFQLAAGKELEGAEQGNYQRCLVTAGLNRLRKNPVALGASTVSTTPALGAPPLLI